MESLMFTAEDRRGPVGRDERKTALDAERAGLPPLSRRPDGSIAIGSFGLAQQVLRGGSAEQAGFNARLAKLLPQRNISVLFQEGEAHRRQRSAAAPFFTPAAVSTRYRPLMERISRELVAELVRSGRAVLDEMTLALTAGVAAEIVGMTDSRRPGLGARLGRIFEVQSLSGGGLWRSLRYVAAAQASVLRIYLLDVRPAIRARRRARRDDLVSSLLDQGWSDRDILVECITYGTAGISTTREFIVAAALHLLEREDLRAGFLAGGDEERLAVLTEILRLEPAVSTLYRRTTERLRLDRDDGQEEIAPGSLVAIDVRSVNADTALVGHCPHAIRPERIVRGHADLMSFGDGPHRCPGATVALHEAAIFLDHLLRVPNLRLASGPTMTRNGASTGYVLRDVVLTIDAEPHLERA